MPLAVGSKRIGRSGIGESARQGCFGGLENVAGGAHPGAPGLSTGDESGAGGRTNRLGVSICESHSLCSEGLQVDHRREGRPRAEDRIVVERARVRAPVVNDQKEDVVLRLRHDGVSAQLDSGRAAKGGDDIEGSGTEIGEIGVECNLLLTRSGYGGEVDCHVLKGEAHGQDRQVGGRCLTRISGECHRHGCEGTRERIGKIEPGGVERSQIGPGNAVEVTAVGPKHTCVRNAKRVTLGYRGRSEGRPSCGRTKVSGFLDHVGSPFNPTPDERNLALESICGYRLDGVGFFGTTLEDCRYRCAGLIGVGNAIRSTAERFAKVSTRNIVGVDGNAVLINTGEVGPRAVRELRGDAPARIVFVEVEVDAECHAQITLVVVILHVAAKRVGGTDIGPGKEGDPRLCIEAGCPGGPGIANRESGPNLVAGNHAPHAAIWIEGIRVAIRPVDRKSLPGPSENRRMLSIKILGVGVVGLVKVRAVTELITQGGGVAVIVVETPDLVSKRSVECENLVDVGIPVPALGSIWNVSSRRALVGKAVPCIEHCNAVDEVADYSILGQGVCRDGSGIDRNPGNAIELAAGKPVAVAGETREKIGPGFICIPWPHRVTPEPGGAEVEPVVRVGKFMDAGIRGSGLATTVTERRMHPRRGRSVGDRGIVLKHPGVDARAFGVPRGKERVCLRCHHGGKEKEQPSS